MYNSIENTNALDEMLTQRRSGSENDLATNSRSDEEPNSAGRDNMSMEAPPSGDEGDPNEGSQRRRYNRHTQHQTTELELFFKECPHPDDKQRKALGRELGLEPSQIKFWFQNKRTQVKSQQERYENNLLKAENDQLRGENNKYKNSLALNSCRSCGACSPHGEMSFDEQQLRIENAQLKEEIQRMSRIIAECSGNDHDDSSSENQMSWNSLSLDLGVGNGDNYGAQAAAEAEAKAAQARAEAAQAHAEALQAQAVVVIGEMHDVINPLRQLPLLSSFDRSLILEIGAVAMEELNQLSMYGEPLWVPGKFGSDVINEDEYLRRFPRGIGPTLHAASRTESSRHSAVVTMNHMTIVAILMNVNQWSNVFCGIVSKAVTHQVLSPGEEERYDGAYQVMSAEFQVPSPFVQTRGNYFIRYSKKQRGESWAVVDFAMDYLRPSAATRTRRRPSGCIIQELPNGYSKVIWVEHVELDASVVQGLYRNLVNSGLAFGAKRWVGVLHRQSERLASAMATITPQDDHSVIRSNEGRKSVLRLAERMTLRFSTAAGASIADYWTPIPVAGIEDVRIMIRKSSINDPGRPPGIILSAASSIWIPIPARTVFEFLSSEHSRNQWDILSSGGQVVKIAHVSNGRDPGNYVSVLRVVPGNDNNPSTMLLLQESFSDATGSFVVYAPIDLASLNALLDGADPDYVPLLPSGFVILPDGPGPYTGPICEVGSGGGCLLTVAFQILVNLVPTASLDLASVYALNNLIKTTLERTKIALGLLEVT